MQTVGSNNIMRDYTEFRERENIKTLKGLAINEINALPEIGGNELLYKIINLMSEERKNREKLRDNLYRKKWSKIWV